MDSDRLVAQRGASLEDLLEHRTLAYHDWIIASTGHVFDQSDDPTMDMIHSTVLAGDQPFEIIGVTGTQTHLVVLADRITVGPEQPETQIRFYNQPSSTSSTSPTTSLRAFPSVSSATRSPRPPCRATSSS